MSKITQLAISQKVINQNQKKKLLFWRIYFYSFILVFGIKIQDTSAEKSQMNFFDMCKIDT